MGLWVDVLIIFITGVIVYVESKRGFIPALTEFLGVCGILVLVDTIDGPVARSVAVFSRPETNVAFFHILLFLVLCAPVVMLGSFMGGAVGLSVESFDAILGALCGFAAAMVVCRAIVGGLLMGAATGGSVYASITTSALGREVLYYETWHNFVDAVTRIGVYPENE